METVESKNKRVSSVEFWRFVFTVLVCLYHLEIYFQKRRIFLSGSSAVEFFFILAGFLIAMSAAHKQGGERPSVREAHMAALDFVKKKLKAIYPILICWLVIWLFTAPDTGVSRLNMLMNSEWELLMMEGTPFGFRDGFAPNIPLWFLTALITVGYVYTYAIRRHYDFVCFAAPAIGLLLYIYFALNATSTLDHNIKMGFLNAGMVKAAAEMSLGVAVYTLYERIRQKKLGIAWRVVLALVEIYAVYRLFALMLMQPIGWDNYRRVLYIMIIILTSFLNLTPLTRVLNNRFSRALGHISLAMYITHYSLITVYFNLLFKAKMKLMRHIGTSDAARRVFNFLKNTGGFDDKYKPIPMGVKDMVLYMLLVVLTAVVITGLTALTRVIARDVRAKQIKKRDAAKFSEESDEVKK